MNNIESLHHLTEVVETAGADIAPTYAEYNWHLPSQQIAVKQDVSFFTA